MIIFDHVSKVYPNGVKGLSDVSLSIEQGEFVGIIGLSGAGKSTLIRSINRMHDITDGTLTVDGTDVGSLKGKELRKFRRKIGMIFQSFNLVTRTTVIKNVLTSFVPDMPFWRVLLGVFPKEMKVKALVKPTCSTTSRVWAKSSSVSPGKPTIISVVMAASGTYLRMSLIKSRYFSLV